MSYNERNEIKKEILTKDNIKLDYKKQLLSGIKIIIIMPIVLLLLLIFILYLFSFLKTFTIIYKIIVVAPITFFIFLFLAVLYDSYRKLHLINKGKFYITTDKLVSCEEKRSYGGSAFAASFSKPYILNFASYGSYCIPEVKNHNSSKLFEMDDKGVFNSSQINDVFYLVICNDKEIVLAYNTKLFELID